MQNVDEAVGDFDQSSAEQFAQIINQLRGKVRMLFFTRNLPVDVVFALALVGTRP